MENPITDKNQDAGWPHGVAGLAELISVQAGSVVSRVLLKRKSGNVTLFAFDVAQELSEHTAPFDALIQVVEGEAEVRIDGQPHGVRVGEVILLPAGHPHGVRAVGVMKMVLTMIRE